MDHLNLGQTGLEVSRPGFGMMSFASPGGGSDVR
jgi:hypothetical protein